MSHEVNGPQLYNFSIEALKQYSELMMRTNQFFFDDSKISHEESYSQLYQDIWVLDTFNYKSDGIFVDIGANDGITYSNRYN